MSEIKADILAVYFEALAIISCTLLGYRVVFLLSDELGGLEAMMLFSIV